MTLLRESLKNLRIMHEAKYMHRDVLARNLLIMLFNSSKTILCDFDKARHASFYRDTHIKFISTLAFEVDSYT